MTNSLTTLKAEFRINGVTIGAQEDASVAARPDGGFQVVWESSDGDGFGVFGRDFGAEGQKQGRQFQINTITEGDQSNPDVAFDADGNGAWTWQSSTEISVDANNNPVFDALALPQIRAKGFGYDSPAFQEEWNVFTSLDQANTVPTLAMQDNGDFLVAFTARNSANAATDPNATEAQVGVFDPSASFANRFDGFHNPTTVSQPGWVSSDADVTALDSGGYLFVWGEHEDFFRRDGFVRGEILDASGTVTQSFEVAQSGTTGPVRNPSATELKNGNIVVTWAEQDQTAGVGADFNVWMSILDETGGGVRGPIRVHSDSSLPQSFPEIVALKDGGFIITWSDYSNSDGGSVSAPASVFAQRFDKNGTALGRTVQVNDTGLGNQEESDLAVLENGNLVVTWEGSESEFGTKDIFAEIYNIPVYGAKKAQLMTGANLDDKINGKANDDTVAGAEGNDTLKGGGGSDRVLGQSGDDVVRGGTGADVVDGGAGADTVRGDAGNDKAFGKAGADTVLGGKGADTVNGGGGADTIDGGLGKDRVLGKGGADDLNGGKGKDRVDGAKGADRVDGGAGNDVLKGGLGADTFVYASGKDTILDFKDNVDTLEFDAGLRGGLTIAKLRGLADDSVDGQLTFEFGAKNILTVRGIDSFSDLRNDIDIA